MLASEGGYMEVVKYLYEAGGKDLLMMTSGVSVWMHVWTCVVVDVHGRRRGMMQACSHVRL